MRVMMKKMPLKFPEARKNRMKTGPWLWFLAIGMLQMSALADPPQLRIPRAKVAPVIDGVLNDEAWRDAAVIDGLRPHIGGETWNKINRVPTKIRVTWNPEYLFIAFECRDPDIFVTGTLPRDGALYTEDVCEVFIDGMGDQRQWIELQVNALNQTLDLMMLYTGPREFSATGRLLPEHSATDFWSFRCWQAPGVITAAGRIVENGEVAGWTVEMAIPAKNFLRRRGIDRIEPMEIRANFVRYDYPVNENGQRELLHMNWAPVEHGCPHISPAAMGVLILE